MAQDPNPSSPLPPPFPHHLTLWKNRTAGRFWQADEKIVEANWLEDGNKCGEVFGDGKIGFLQMAQLSGKYANLMVHRIAGE